MQGSIHVGSIAGIRIDINYGWLIILVLATISLAAGWFPEAIQGLGPGVYYILGFSAAILLFLSVLAHELAHVLVARACGLPVKSVTLFIFGGVSDLDSAPRSAGTEFLVAAIGPVISLVIGTAHQRKGFFTGLGICLSRPAMWMVCPGYTAGETNP